MRSWILVLVVAGSAHAQDPVRDLLPEGEHDLDPIGTGDTASLRDVPPPTSNEPPPDPTLGPVSPPIDAQRGEVLWAIPGIREVDHDIDVQLVNGMAVVDVEMRFISRARYAGELRYHLPVPQDAVAVSLEVCRGTECRQGIPDDASANSNAYFDALRARGESGKPIGHVARIDDSLVVRAAPVMRGAPTSIRLRWVASAPVQGGVARLRIPPRGNDLRVARATARLQSPDLHSLVVQDAPYSGAVHREAWESIDFAANVHSGGAPHAQIDTFQCGSARCARARVSAGLRLGRADSFVVLIDASPSMHSARSQVHSTIATLLAHMPARSTVRVIAFAGRAEALLSQPTAPDQVALTTIANAPSMALGSATRFESAWNIAKDWGQTHVIVVGDGGMTQGDASRRAFREARQRRVRLSILNISDRPTSSELRSQAELLRGTVIEAGSAIRSGARLDEAIRPLFAPEVGQVRVQMRGRTIDLGSLRAGEELSWEGPIVGAASVRVGSRRTRARRASQPWLQARGRVLGGVPTSLSAIDANDRQVASRSDCNPRGPSQRASGVSGEVGVVPSEPLQCGPAPLAAAPSGPQPGRGVPAETLLQMLRGRIVPVARGCFRRDRAGRVDYSRRATFVFRLANREVIAAEVEGEIHDELRACLLSAIDHLDVPYFEGEVAVRYPLYTERGERPPTIEIESRVLDAVDRVAGDQPTRPPSPDR